MEPTKLETEQVRVGTADTYQFKYKGAFAWAIFTVNNVTGEFSIQSDFGSWSYRWRIDAIGKDSEEHPKPLAHFLTKADSHYIAVKFGYNKPHDLDYVFSKEETIKEFRKQILDEHSPYSFTEEDARKVWDELDEWLSEVGDHSNEAALISCVETISDYEHLYKILPFNDPHDIWECLIFKKSVAHDYLIDTLLPHFQRYLKENVLVPNK